METAAPDMLVAMRDREEIRDVLALYGRAIDRRDRELLARLFWPDGSADYGGFKGSGAEFVDWAMARTAQFSRSQHFMGQSVVRSTTDRAAAETYFRALQTPLQRTATCADEVVAGRYLDQFERRAGEWRILRRVVAFEWFRHYPTTGEWAASPLGQSRQMGGRKPQDPVYDVFADFPD